MKNLAESQNIYIFSSFQQRILDLYKQNFKWTLNVFCKKLNISLKSFFDYIKETIKCEDNMYI